MDQNRLLRKCDFKSKKNSKELLLGYAQLPYHLIC